PRTRAVAGPSGGRGRPRPCRARPVPGYGSPRPGRGDWARSDVEESQPEVGGGIARRGARLLWGYVKANPGPFAISITGAAIYAAAAVGMTIALGRITNEVIIPSFETGRVSGSTAVAAGAVRVILGLIRASTIAMRRYSAAMLTFRTQAAWRRQLSSTYLEVPLRYHRRTPTGQLLAHADADILAATEVINPLPFSIGVVTLVVV